MNTITKGKMQSNSESYTPLLSKHENRRSTMMMMKSKDTSSANDTWSTTSTTSISDYDDYDENAYNDRVTVAELSSLFTSKNTIRTRHNSNSNSNIDPHSIVSHVSSLSGQGNTPQHMNSECEYSSDSENDDGSFAPLDDDDDDDDVSFAPLEDDDDSIDNDRMCPSDEEDESNNSNGMNRTAQKRNSIQYNQGSFVQSQTMTSTPTRRHSIEYKQGPFEQPHETTQRRNSLQYTTPSPRRNSIQYTQGPFEQPNGMTTSSPRRNSIQYSQGPFEQPHVKDDISEKVSITSDNVNDYNEHNYVQQKTLPGLDNSYKVVCVSFMDTNIATSVACKILDESLRMLKPGGLIYVIDKGGCTVKKHPTMRQWLSRVYDPTVKHLIYEIETRAVLQANGFVHTKLDENNRNVVDDDWENDDIVRWIGIKQ